MENILENFRIIVLERDNDVMEDIIENSNLLRKYRNSFIKLKNIEKEADAILAASRKKALKRQEEIVADAKEEAARILANADHEIELQKAKVKDQMKQEIIQTAVIMAGKIISDKITAQEQNTLVDETLQEMGDKTWLQE